MSKLSGAIKDIKSMDELSALSSPIHNINPLIKLIITFVYIFIIVSFNKYNLAGLIMMVLFLLAGFILSDISFLEALNKIKIFLPIFILFGVFNPILDHSFVSTIGSITVTGGMVSFVTLFIKGVFSILASYLLIATTGIEKICYALRKLHLPRIIVTQILLTYRYITVLLTEANHIYQAYSLRAPKQKGVHYKVWGSLMGQLLLRSIDRANEVYESMLIRGYKGDFYPPKKTKIKISDIIYVLFWLGYFYIARFTLLFDIIGRLFI